MKYDQDILYEIHPLTDNHLHTNKFACCSWQKGSVMILQRVYVTLSWCAARVCSESNTQRTHKHTALTFSTAALLLNHWFTHQSPQQIYITLQHDAAWENPIQTFLHTMIILTQLTLDLTRHTTGRDLSSFEKLITIEVNKQHFRHFNRPPVWLCRGTPMAN